MNHRQAHHYVTQSYLRGFSTGSGRKAMLYVYERNRPEPFRQKPQQAARQTDYYSFQKQDGTRDNSVEALLGLVEGEAVPILRDLASKEFQPNWDQRARVALLIAFQELRVPWLRENIQDVQGEIVKWMAKSQASAPGLLESDLRELEERGRPITGVTADSLREFITRGEYDIQVNPAVSLLNMLQLAPLLHGFYIEMKWTVIRSSGRTQFVTSDNPVVKTDPCYRGGFYGVGLYSRTIEIRFPISKTACLLITKDRQREDRWHELINAGRELEARQLRETVPSTTFVQPPDAIVGEINALTIRYAKRFVYSPRRDARITEIIQGEPQGLRIRMG